MNARRCLAPVPERLITRFPLNDSEFVFVNCAGVKCCRELDGHTNVDLLVLLLEDRIVPVHPLCAVAVAS